MNFPPEETQALAQRKPASDKQAIVSYLAQRALETRDDHVLFEDTVRLVAQGIRAKNVHVLELLREEPALRVRAAFGTSGYLVGETISTKSKSTAGLALESTEPIVTETGLCAAIGCPGKRPFGVLAVQADGGASADDVQFMQEVVLVLFAAVERNRVEAEWAKLHEEALDAVRTHDELLAVASHDLKTPLTALQLELQSLHAQAIKGLPLPAVQVITQVERGMSQVSRIIEMLDELSRAARATTMHLKILREEIDLADVTLQMAERLRGQIVLAGCTLSLRAEEATGNWDRRQLEQIALQLIANAVQNGRGAPIELVVERTDRQARLLVRDQGPGISEEDQACLLVPFPWRGRTGKGRSFGIGLWIARRSAEALGGSISYENQPGSGSIFTLTLPCT
ncbi:MAG: HAMP domain-containing histidine kinase [Deltaproteobacteria bacterium]|nr:HAMP domain-containing histidine kinase [Deltaproteobacteria bacterium]